MPMHKHHQRSHTHRVQRVRRGGNVALAIVNLPALIGDALPPPVSKSFRSAIKPVIIYKTSAIARGHETC